MMRQAPSSRILICRAVLGAAFLGFGPAAFGFTITDFAVDPAHATLGNPHEVASPPFNSFQLTVNGTFSTGKCYQVSIKREGGSSCGSANSSGVDNADVFADHIVAYISPSTQNADFKVGADWRIEVIERNAGCSGGSTTKTFPSTSGQPYLRIRGCNNGCILSSLVLTVKPNPADCGEQVTICAKKSDNTTLGSGNLEYDWDLDGDGTCGTCSGGSNSGKKCGEPSDCPGGSCYSGGGFDDLTTNTGDPNCLPDQPCCVTTQMNATHVVGVKIRDKGTNNTCTACTTKLVTVDDDKCDDKQYCNGEERCDAQNGCVTENVPNCNDGIACTTDACNEDANSCTHTPNNAMCNDGLYCNGVETCHPTLGCQAGTPPNCNDGVSCTVDSCNEATDSCVHTTDNSLCNDGAFCNGAETCDAVAGCKAGTPPNCNDGVGCTVDSCNEATDLCDHIACEEGKCTANRTVVLDSTKQTSGCSTSLRPKTTALEDASFVLSARTGVADGSPTNPDASGSAGKIYINSDGTSVKTSSCGGNAGIDGSGSNDDEEVIFTFDNPIHADSIILHLNKILFSTDTPVIFISSAAASGYDYTILEAVIQSSFTSTGTEQGYVSFTGFAALPANLTIDKFKIRETAGSIYIKKIEYADTQGVGCSDGQYCNGAEVCHPTLGCQPGTPPNCNDGVTCTHDSCNEASDTCDHVTDNALCLNGQYCDGNETCHPTLGCQAGTSVDCSDGIACTTDACNEATDSCTHSPNNAVCSDGQFCNGTETCNALSGCVPGSPPNCSDGVACTLDSCDETNDTCRHKPKDNQCDDGLYCNGVESCNAATGCQGGTAPNCDDGVGCTLDACDEDNNTCTHTANHAACGNGLFCDGAEYCDATGCHDAADPCAPPTICDEPGDRCVTCLNDAQCNDGLFCNGAETCNLATGTCVPGTPPSCDDSVACTVDACNPGTNSCTQTPDNGACNNGLYCDGEETCNATLGCQAGPAPNCDDTVACTIDTCNETTNTCDHSPNHASCGDGLFCNGSETCDPINGCQLGTAPNCNDGVFCTTDACDESLDACTHTTNDAVCGDGLYCNGDEFCHATNDCQPGTPINCNDGVGCTADTCDEANDICTHVPNDAVCVDALFCNGLEYCDVNLGCQPGSPVNCSDGVSCTLDACDEATDSCLHTADNAHCVDSLYCNGVEFCDPILDCQAGTPVNCADLVACTLDACDEGADACTHTPNNSVCQDGLFCDGQEFCDLVLGCQDAADPCAPPTLCDEPNDRCVTCFTDAQCNDGLFCNGVETCNVAAGVCVPGTPPSCDDGIACTNDFCSTQFDTCKHSPVNSACDNGLECDGNETCSPTLGCLPGSPHDCSDGNACTVDSCNEDTDSCDHFPDNGLCDDGQYCNGVEICHPRYGCQAGTPPNCTDGVACTTDVCNEDTDTCDHLPNNGVCSDSLFCNGTEVCDPLNGCQAGPPPNCDDAITCTLDACDEATDTCSHAPDNSLCDDLLYCNGTETCDPLNGCVGTPPVNCDDLVACTLDACDEVNDICVHTPNDALCDNGLYCDGTELCDPLLGCTDPPNPCQPPTKCDEPNDRCVSCLTDAQCTDGLFCNGLETCNLALGICIPGTPPVCGDGVACTIDACDETADACTHSPDHSTCADSQYCNGVEVCDPILGCQSGPPPNCADAIPCTVDSCNEATDSCVHAPNDAVCADGAYCNGVETCNPLTGCTPGTPPNCGDGIPCTVDGCDEGADTCTHSPNDAACSNNLFCDGSETCDPINGCVSGPAPNCSDGVDCTLDSCNEAIDACVHGPSDAFCADGVFCNGVEVCDPINGCQTGPPVNCDDGIGCTVDDCNESTRLCTNAPDDVLCDDSFFCTGAERCDPLAGCVAGTPPNCADAVDCTVDACSPLTDTCSHLASNEVCNDQQSCTTDICTLQGCTNVNTECGACCLMAGPCMDGSTMFDCSNMPGQGGNFLGVGTVCSGIDSDNDGTDDSCDIVDTVPTVSEWGLVILTLFLLIGAKLAFGKMRPMAVS